MQLISKIKNVFCLSNTQRRSLGGYIFTLPFVIGFIFFFLYPFLQAVIFSISKMHFSSTGYELEYSGITNYNYAILTDPNFVRIFTETIGNTMLNLPFILGFSFFAAIILNEKFKGRMLARAIFFLPVIMGAGIVLRMEMNDYMAIRLQQSGETILMFSTEALRSFLMEVKLPEVILEYIMDAVEAIPNIIRVSGIQILIFLAGLQSIPSSIYEAAKVEGATGWESFWLVTLPMMSPIIITNVVYTIIDTFTVPTNRIVTFIESISNRGHYGISMAMSVMYFVTIFIVLLVVIGIISRWVFYHE